ISSAALVVEEGISAHRVAKEMQIPYTTVVEWARKYRVGGRAVFEQAPGRGGKRASGYPQAARVRPLRTEARGPVGNRAAKPDARREAVLAVKREQPQAGSRRIRDVVKRFFGIGTSDTTVRRLLKSEGLAQPRTPPKLRPKPRDRSFER